MALMRYAVLVAATAIAVVVIPGFFQKLPPITIDGFVAPGFEDVHKAFRENFESGRDPRFGGSAFSVYHRGEKVVDLWGGYADVESHQKWKEDTLTIVYSSTKAFASICIAMLVDRGLLDYNKPVADYWPEFAQKGKGEITVKQMMEHKAGLILAAPPGLSLEILQDVAKAGDLMARTEPTFEPSQTESAYHSLTIGPLTNELLRRVDPQHRTMGQFFREEIAEPFDIDFHIGLPFEMNHRVARMVVDKRSFFLKFHDVLYQPKSLQSMMHMMKTGLFAKTLENGGELGTVVVANDPVYRAIELPSALGFGTARDMAKLFSILAAGGTDPVTNKTLLSRERIDDFMDAAPPLIDRVIGIPASFGKGMWVSDDLDGIKLFGHPGLGGQEVYADLKNEVSFAFIGSVLQPYTNLDGPRFLELFNATYSSIERLG